MAILCEDLINQLRQNMALKEKTIIPIPQIKEKYKGVYLFYILNNVSCCNYLKDTASFLLTSNKHHHPLYHSILASSNTKYTFFNGSNGFNRDFELLAFDNGDDNKQIRRYCKRFGFYLEETECLFSKTDIKRKEHLKRIYSSKDFVGCFTHINETAKCLNSAFDTTKNQYLSLPSIDFGFSQSYFDRSVNEEEVIVFMPTSWGNDSEQQCLSRGIHVIDKAFIKAKTKCEKLKLVLINPNKKIRLISREKYEKDVLVIRGKIDDNMLHYLYASTDINVLLSLRIHAHTMLTSLSVGHACIGTNTFGFNDFVSDNGVLFEPPINGTDIDEDYGSITNHKNYNKYANDFDSIKNSNKFVDDTADKLIELYNDRQLLRTMRYNSYVKNITDFSIKRHQETLYNSFVSGSVEE